MRTSWIIVLALVAVAVSASLAAVMLLPDTETSNQPEPAAVPDTDDQPTAAVPDTRHRRPANRCGTRHRRPANRCGTRHRRPDTDDQPTAAVPDTDDQPEPAAVPDTDDQPEPAAVPDSIAMANNDFTIDFYRKISNKDGNHFFSPISIFIAFSALYEGARQNTAEQMEQVFGLEPDEASRHNATYSFMSSINRGSEHFTLEMANAIWFAERLKLYQSYADIVRNSYLADVENVDFLDGGVEIINGWAYEKTHEKIKKVLRPADVSERTAMVITNAIYFKGTWVTQFAVDDTEKLDFWKSSSESTQTDFMNVLGTFNYTAADGVNVLEMPYEGDRLSMLVMLPDDIDGISRVEDMLSADLVEQWRHKMGPIEVEVSMPKFKMETSYDLFPPLEELGMPDVFSSAKANLSGIGKALKPEFEGNNLYVTKALQSAYVDVNEEGTEAAAVTAIVIDFDSATPPPPRFTADHPFIFMIVDNESSTILFMGRMSDPAA